MKSQPFCGRSVKKVPLQKADGMILRLCAGLIGLLAVWPASAGQLSLQPRGSLGCALAPSIGWFLGFRVLQSAVIARYPETDRLTVA